MTEKQEGTLQGALVTGNFSIQATMPNGKTINVSGYLYEGESVESVNNRVNLFHDIVDHQRTRSEIPELEARRDQGIQALSQMKDVLAGLEAKQKNGGKLTSQEKLTIQNMGTNITRVSEDIEKGEKAISDAKKKVGLS